MSFKFTNASTTCQELINNAFKKHLNIFVITYFDDIFVYFKNMNEHVRYCGEARLLGGKKKKKNLNCKIEHRHHFIKN